MGKGKSNQAEPKPTKGPAAPPPPPAAPPQPAPRLSEDQVELLLAARPEWSETSGTLQRTFQFSDFVAAMGFVDRVAAEAERAQHHPDILIRYNKVTMTLSTHDSGGITQKDFDLAARMDEMVAG